MAQALNSYDLVRRQLRPLGLRLRLSDTLLFASRSLWVGLSGVALVAIVGRFVPIPDLRLWAALPLALWVVAVLGYSLFRPLSPRRVAQRVDLILGLRERLATAL